MPRGMNKAEIGEGAVGVPGMPLREVLYVSELAEIGGANVTVSRTHTGFSFCVQIITTLNRFEAKQGKALFTDACGKQRLSCPPTFNMTAVQFPWAGAHQCQGESDVVPSAPSRAKVGKLGDGPAPPGGRMT